jgi:hypothetical protein
LERDGYNRPLAGLENDDQMDIKWGRWKMEKDLEMGKMNFKWASREIKVALFE